MDVFGGELFDEVEVEAHAHDQIPKPAAISPEEIARRREAAKARHEERRITNEDRFDEKKNFILANLSASCREDFSPKGSVDERCYPVMSLLNSHPDFVTTSSCSGRIALFHMLPHFAPKLSEDDDSAEEEEGSEWSSKGTSSAVLGQKRHGGSGWLFCSHETLTDESIAVILQLLGDEKARLRAATAAATPPAEGDPDSPTVQLPPAPLLAKAFSHGIISLKMEPFVMHVQCRTLAAARIVHHVASTMAGYRNSGLTVGRHFFTVAIRHSTAIDCPLVIEGVACTDLKYASRLLRYCNARLEENFLQLKKLEDVIRKTLEQPVDPDMDESVSSLKGELLKEGSSPAVDLGHPLRDGHYTPPPSKLS
jgi:tRNA wybutosine-synthesizing protein 3